MIIEVGVFDLIDDALGLALGIVGVDAFQVIGVPALIGGADVDGKVAALAAIVDELLRGVEVAFPETVFFEDVAPTTRANLEIECLSRFDGSPRRRRPVPLDIWPWPPLSVYRAFAWGR